MALLPDLVVAGEAALVAFLLTLGVLVVFVESFSGRTAALVLLVALVLAALLVVLGEAGVGLILVGFASAFVANGVFDWLTTR